MNYELSTMQGAELHFSQTGIPPTELPQIVKALSTIAVPRVEFFDDGEAAHPVNLAPGEFLLRGWRNPEFTEQLTHPHTGQTVQAVTSRTLAEAEAARHNSRQMTHRTLSALFTAQEQGIIDITGCIVRGLNSGGGIVGGIKPRHYLKVVAVADEFQYEIDNFWRPSINLLWRGIRYLFRE